MGLWTAKQIDQPCRADTALYIFETSERTFEVPEL
jgi:hypothetical protein